jgi:hypothetical protein
MVKFTIIVETWSMDHEGKGFREGDYMMFDYGKEEQAFLTELESGKYSIERISNNADKYREKEARDEAVYRDYLHSDSFSSLDSEASK